MFDDLFKHFMATFIPHPRNRYRYTAILCITSIPSTKVQTTCLEYKVNFSSWCMIDTIADVNSTNFITSGLGY